MPELPEVETVARGLAPAWEGHTFQRVEVRCPRLRRPFPPMFAGRLEGRSVLGVKRRAKYLLAFLNDEQVLIGHLGMSGRFRIAPPLAESPGPHDHVLFQTHDGPPVLYQDPRRFGLFDLCPAATLDQHPLLVHLGPEPLSPDFSPFTLQTALRRRGGPVKTVLLDQSVVAGLGNIYVCESLFQAGVSPLRPAASLSEQECAALHAAIVDVLSRASAAGGSSLRDYRQANGELGYFQHAFSVYGRHGQPCPDCTCSQHGGILKIPQAGRSTFYCAFKQR